MVIESFRSFAQGGEVAAVLFEVDDQQARQCHEVVLNDAHDMEAVSDDARVGEVASDLAAVGAGEIDAHDFYLFAAFELAEEGG